jgi:hypothetical protein
VFNFLAILRKKIRNNSSSLKRLERKSLHVLEFIGDQWTDETKKRAYELFQKYRPGMFNHWKLYMFKGRNGEECPAASKEAPRYDEITWGGSWEELEKDLDFHFSN